MAQLYFGFDEQNITPEKKISLAGQFAERISEYVEKPLTATAMAVECGGEQLVLVSCDLVGVSFNLVEDLRLRLRESLPELDPNKVVLTAIHTHTGPVYPREQKQARVTGSSGSFRALLEAQLPPGRKYVESAPVSSDPDVATPQEVYALLLDRLEKAVTNAWRKRAPGSFSNAFGRVAVGMCRRAAYSDGSAQMWGDTNTAVFTALEGGSDSGLELMYVFDAAGKLTAVLPNLACPAQCVQHRLFVSPDFWGETKKLLRERFGEEVYMLPLCSPAGDQCPVDLVRWVDPESDVHDPNLKRTDPPARKADPSMFDLAGMRKVGKRIANEIIGVYEEGLDAPQADVPFTHHVLNCQLPLRRATLADKARAESAIRDWFRDHPGDVDFNTAAELQIYLGILRRMQVQEKMETLDTEVHVLRMGSVAIATNPFELFLDYGNVIRARAKCEQTFLVQLANGTEGYLPTEKAEKGGHYSAFIASGQIGHEGGELLVRQTLKEINSLF